MTGLRRLLASLDGASEVLGCLFLLALLLPIAGPSLLLLDGIPWLVRVVLDEEGSRSRAGLPRATVVRR